MVDYANHGQSVNVRIPHNNEQRGQELRSSLLEANYANKQEPTRAYPSNEAPLRTPKFSKTTNVMMTQLAADILAIMSTGEKSVRNH